MWMPLAQQVLYLEIDDRWSRSLSRSMILGAQLSARTQKGLHVDATRDVMSVLLTGRNRLPRQAIATFIDPQQGQLHRVLPEKPTPKASRRG